MPYYYDVSRGSLTSNASGNTLETHFLALTTTAAATARPAHIIALYGTMRSGTAGGGSLRLITCATIGSGGTTHTPGPRRANMPAAKLVTTYAATAGAITAGGTPAVRVAVGLAQTGGMGGWVAVEPDDAMVLEGNAGATGNAEVSSISNAASILLDATFEFKE